MSLCRIVQFPALICFAGICKYLTFKIGREQQIQMLCVCMRVFVCVLLAGWWERRPSLPGGSVQAAGEVISETGFHRDVQSCRLHPLLTQCHHWASTFTQWFRSTARWLVSPLPKGAAPRVNIRSQYSQTATSDSFFLFNRLTNLKVLSTPFEAESGIGWCMTHSHVWYAQAFALWIRKSHPGLACARGSLDRRCHTFKYWTHLDILTDHCVFRYFHKHTAATD